MSEEIKILSEKLYKILAQQEVILSKLNWSSTLEKPKTNFTDKTISEKQKRKK